MIIRKNAERKDRTNDKGKNEIDLYAGTTGKENQKLIHTFGVRTSEESLQLSTEIRTMESYAQIVC